ncbi:MAG: TRAP transporter small permease subunit [Pseudomonadota bacterium]
MLRSTLDGIYRISGWLSAGFVVLIFAVVFGQVVLNIVSAAIERLTGQTIGLLIPSYSDLSGFFLAAATFFGMAYTFRHDGHIRVTLFTSRFPEKLRRSVEIAALAIALIAIALMAFEAIVLAYDSWVFGDSSYGLLAIPIWLPQASYVLGAIAFTICIGDALVTTLMGQPFGETPAPADNSAD